MDAAMPRRLPLFVALLLLSALLLTAAVVNAAPAETGPDPLTLEEPGEEEAGEEGEEGEEVTECELAKGEVEEAELTQDEANAICEEEEDEGRPAARPRQSDAGRRPHRHRKACRRKATAGKRHCAHRPRRR